MADYRNRKHIQIRLEEPKRLKRGRPEGSGPVQNYLRRLEAKHPNQWAIFDRKANSTTHLKRLQNKEFPNLEYAQRKNGDGKTLSVWVRMVTASVPAEYTMEVAEEALEEMRRNIDLNDKETEVIAKAFEALIRGDS